MVDKIERFSGGYGFLSNFYDSPLTYEGVHYPTAEHAYQAAKSLDPAMREIVASLGTPADAKRMGRKMDIRPDWEVVKVSVMEEILRIKFAAIGLKKRLLATGDAELIEGNTWRDRFWGVYNGEGRNELGKALMRVRADLARDQ